VAKSLSAFLPVYNAQARLRRLICELVDVLPEITPQWRLVLIDDGSTDATPEVGHDIAKQYPQVQIVSHPIRLGWDAAVRTGLRNTRSELSLICCAMCEFDLTTVDRLWKRMAECDVAEGFERPVEESSWSLGGKVGSLPLRARRRNHTRGAVRMIWRPVLDQWHAAGSMPLEQFLGQQQLRRALVPLSRRKEALPMPRGVVETTGLGQGAATAGGPPRPNFLSRVKAFALGE
jgi:hypothetical protein